VIVLDASVLVAALAEDTDGGRAAAGAIGADDEWAAPDHLLVEVTAALRSLRLGRKLSEERATAALRFLRRAEFTRVDSRLLLARMWELKDNLSAYDAAYVAAAEALDVPLVTTDRRLAGAAGLRCEVRVPGR
jgi:predicted nucleic acid-binding protein